MRTLLTGVAVLMLVVSCSGDAGLRTEEAGAPLSEGQYDIFLYETVGEEGQPNVFVILDLEGDPYEFIPPELYRKLRQEKEVPADEALERAAVMLGEKRGRQYLMRRILSEDVIIGYELIPRDSYPAPRAVTNLLRIEYHVDQEGKVRFRSMPLPGVERDSGGR